MRSDLYTGTFGCAFSIFMFYNACQLPQGMFGTLGAGFFPKIIFGVLAVFTFVLAVKSLCTQFGQKNNTEAAEPFQLTRYTYVITAFVAFFLYVTGLKYLGFIIASMLFLPTLMWILGPKTKRSLIPISLTSIGITGAIYISFTKFLKVFLPSGSLF